MMYLMYLIIMFLQLIYYLYAMVGMELFGNRIVNDGSPNCGNPKLNGTEFALKRYCPMNFNDIGHSYLTLFTLMVVNQWHGKCINIIILLSVKPVYSWNN